VRVLVLVLRLAGAALDFRDEVSCPVTAAVIERLHHMAPEATEADYVVHLRRSGSELLLQLDDRAGSPLASRQLPADADCAELADAVAVTLAAWEAQFSREAPPVPPSAPLPREVVSSPSEPTAEATGTSGATRHFGFAALVLGTADGAGAGIAGELDARWEYLLACLLADSPHGVSFAPGELHWQRTSLGLGGVLHIVEGRWDFSARAFVLGALLARWGTGYGVDESSVSPDLGLGAGLRAAFRLSSSVGLLADFSAVAWPFTQDIVVAGVPGFYTLPIWQLYFGFGVSYENPW
jgi:hypothetical protein